MSHQNTEQTYRTIISRLQSLRTQWRILLLSHSLLRWLGTLAVALAAALLIDQLLPLPRVFRMGLVLLWLGVGVYAAWRYLLRPVFRKLTNDQVAAYVEASHPGFENRILSAVQLKPEMEQNRFGYALGFIERLIEQARQSVDRIETKRVFEKEILKLKKYGGFAAVALALLILIHFLFPSATRDFAQAFDELPKTPQEMLIVQIDEVQPGNAQIESGANVPISVKVTGHRGAPVYLYYRMGQVGESASSPGAWRNLLMTRNKTEIPYRFTIENVTQSMEYYIAAKGATSEHYQITVAREPIMSRFQLKLNYPKYTQLSPQVLEENLGDVTALIGAEVRFDGESNKPLASATLVLEDSEPVKLNVSDGNRLSGSFIIQRSEKYHIALIDTDGVSNSQPITYIIHAIADAEPRIEIVAPGKDVVLDESMIVTLQIDAKDDFGVQQIQLVYRIEGESEDDVIVPLKTWDAAKTAVFIEFPWNLDPIGLFPGDIVSYHAEAIDADNVTGANIGKSGTYAIRFPSLAELYEEIESEQEIEQQGLEALFNEQAEATDMIDELLDKIRKSQELTLKDEKLMQQVLENQKQIEQTAKDLMEDMKKTTEQMEKQQLFDLETVRKYQELQELMDEALSEEHKELLRKLAEALQQQQLSEQEQKLMEANFNQEQFLQQLDRLKELYKQMILQQKLEAAVNQAKELAERQERLMEQLGALADKAAQNSNVNQSAKALAQQEDRVAKGMEDLHDKLDELGEEMSEQANLKRVADEVKRLNQYARDIQITQNLQSTRSQMRGNRMQGAMQSGQQAQQGLNELHQGLDNALEFMRGGNADEALAAIREAVRSGLYLSRTHEQVIDGTNETLQSRHGQYTEGEVKQLQRLAADELSLAAGLNLLATRLWELGKEQVQIDPKIVWRLNATGDALERSARALEDRKPSLAVPIQKQGLADINQVISDLLKAMDGMNQQMSMAGMQNMLEQLQQLAQNQGQLNEMAQQLSQQMRQQGRTPSNEQLLRRLAYEQQLIREATERLADMMERLSEVLGDLKSISEDMKEVEAELQRGSLNQQVIDKQREILTRMLESSKSLQKREVSKKRKSKVAKEPTAATNDAPLLDPKLLETIQQLESNLKSGQAESFPPQYRELIEQYFKALSQQTQKRL
ncbi:MAG: hypothetical protein O7E52_00290 [Candidatus Poribacteria bacterium]|nr:hypothetical protein [Candidatus Poribacteria bacterium]